jgi:hypothetical protein
MISSYIKFVTASAFSIYDLTEFTSPRELIINKSTL